MGKVRIEQLNYYNLLITYYHALNLTENELVVLLLIDAFYQEKPSLISGDLLQNKMSLKPNEIDNIIVSLLDKGFVSYETYNETMVTSPLKAREKVLNYFVNTIIDSKNEDDLKLKDDELQKVMQYLQEKLNRVLTPLEVDKVSSWINDVDYQIIIKAIDNIYQKRGKISSINAVDKEISKILISDDVKNEGFSSVDNISKISIEDALDIASYDWVKKDE